LPGKSQTIGFFTGPKSSDEVARPRPKWREMVAKGLYQSGVVRILEGISRYYEFAPGNSKGLSLLRRTKHSKFAILCYHRIGVGGIPLFSELPAEIFEREMRFLRSHYKVVSLDELCEGMEKSTRNENAVAVTFDDGYRDLYTYALPALKKYEIPATIFLPVVSIETGQVPWYDRIFLTLKVFPQDVLEVLLERPRRFQLVSPQARLAAATEIIEYLRTVPDARRKEHCENLEKLVTLPSEELKDRMLTWDQVRTMCSAGITFGSHTMTHPVVSQLTGEQLEGELSESKRLLEQRIAGTASHFAFPFGRPADCGKAAVPVLARSGYRSAATTVEGTNAPGDNLYELRRTQVCLERSISMFAFKLNQLFLSAGAEDSAAAYSVSSPSRDNDFLGSGQRQSRPNDA
jgi:peptidoglycan/xylan/chitin deacetylase (PgdA/CDA1 family)